MDAVCVAVPVAMIGDGKIGKLRNSLRNSVLIFSGFLGDETYGYIITKNYN